MEQIRIIDVSLGGEVTQAVSARGIQKAIGGYGSDFGTWMSYRIKALSLKEGTDYTVVIDKANYNRKDYYISLSVAASVAEIGNAPYKGRVVADLRRLAPEVEPVATQTRVAVFSPPAHLASVKTMSSVEIVDVINQLRGTDKAELLHFHFIAKVEGHPGISHTNFRGTYLDLQGKERPCYYLPKREAELMVMSESLEVQTQVYDRLTELEQGTVAKLPQSYAQALMELALTVQKTEALQLENAQKAIQIEQQTMLIDTQKPSVEFVDKYVEAQELKPFRVVAKLLGANEREFRNFLVDHGYHRRLNGKWVHTDRYGPKGMKLFDMKTSVNAEGVSFEQSRFTAKGVVVISKRWNERKPVLTRKPSPPPGYTSYNT